MKVSSQTPVVVSGEFYEMWCIYNRVIGHIHLIEPTGEKYNAETRAPVLIRLINNI